MTTAAVKALPEPFRSGRPSRYDWTESPITWTKPEGMTSNHHCAPYGFREAAGHPEPGSSKGAQLNPAGDFYGRRQVSTPVDSSRAEIASGRRGMPKGAHTGLSSAG